MSTSKSMLAFTVLSVAAAAFAGAVFWIPRLRRGSSASSTEENHQASPAEASEAAPASKPSLVIVPFRPAPAPLPTFICRFLFGASPPSAISGSLSIISRALHQILKLTSLPAHMDMIVGPAPMFRESRLQVVNSMTAPTRMDGFSAFLPASPPSSQEVVIWCKKICYFIFFSFVSQSGEMMHIYIVVEFSFSFTGITFSVCSYIRGSGLTSLMCPSAGVIDAIASPALLQVIEEPHAVGPTFTVSSDLQLAVIANSTLISLSRASSAGLTSHDSGNFNGFFSSDSAPSSLSSLSRATSGSSEEIQQEINFEHSWVDEVAQRIQAWRDEMRRLIKRGKKSSSWWRKVGLNLLKALEKRGPALY